mmetsp:Transcript_16553/g.34823  ORF Transcript_16553/g.34823 Transcript_16553/m.34823 type:complete len:185 (-) Transcript_16553:99-653(-)
MKLHYLSFFAIAAGKAFGESADIGRILQAHDISDGYQSITGEVSQEADPCGTEEGALLSCLDGLDGLSGTESNLNACLGCVDVRTIVSKASPEDWCGICAIGAYCTGLGQCKSQCQSEYYAISTCRMLEHGCTGTCDPGTWDAAPIRAYFSGVKDALLKGAIDGKEKIRASMSGSGMMLRGVVG